MSTTMSYFPVPFHLQTADQTAVEQQYAPQMPPAVTVPTAYATVTPAVAGVCSLPLYQQAHQLFQKDAQIITPEAIENVKAALLNSEVQQKAETKKRVIPCKAAGQTWEDPTLADWPMISVCFVEIAMKLMMMSFEKLFHDILLSTWQDILEESMNSKESWSSRKQYVDFLKLWFSNS